MADTIHHKLSCYASALSPKFVASFDRWVSLPTDRNRRSLHFASPVGMTNLCGFMIFYAVLYCEFQGVDTSRASID